jgi:hypothetical protein
MTTEEINSIAYTSVVFGSSAWTGISDMFNSLSSAILEDVLTSFEISLRNKFEDSLAEWICLNWRNLEE